MTAIKWRAIVLAAGRGPDDPMARAFGVSHKCALPVAGRAMLLRVVETLSSSPLIGPIAVSIEEPAIAHRLLGRLSRGVEVVAAERTAAQSARSSVTGFPTLITTADHPLLDHRMLGHFLSEAHRSGADLAVGLARAETILAAYPRARRTFLAFGPDRVSGCNLFALRTDSSLGALDFWSYLEPARKKPWRLVSAFGPVALARYLSGYLNLETAFTIASKRLKLKAVPILLPYAEAAMDVDKPADKELAEAILTSRPPSSAPA